MKLFNENDTKEVRDVMWSALKVMWPLYYFLGVVLSAVVFVGGVWFILCAMRLFGVI